MQLQQLVYLVEVTEKGSINKAANSLMTTQLNISKAINNLESELGFEIFKRNNKGTVLTEQGRNLYKYSKTIMNQMDLINRISSQEAEKVLSVASYPVVTISRLIGQFYRKHKQDNMNLRLMEKRMNGVIEAVASGEAEIGFIMSNNVQRRELMRTLNFKNLEIHTFATDTWYVNVGPKSPFYSRESINIHELLPYHIVRMPDDYFSNLTFYLQVDSLQFTEFKKVIHVDNSGAIINLILNTDMFRFGPGLSKRDLEEYGIKSIPIERCDIKIDASWIKRKKEILSVEAKEFVEDLEKIYQ